MACIPHAIDVGANHKSGRMGRKALIAAYDVTGRVKSRFHTRFAHPFQDACGAGLKALAEKRAEQP